MQYLGLYMNTGYTRSGQTYHDRWAKRRWNIHVPTALSQKEVDKLARYEENPEGIEEEDKEEVDEKDEEDIQD